MSYKSQGNVGMANYHHPYFVPLHLSSLHHLDFEEIFNILFYILYIIMLMLCHAMSAISGH